MEPLDEYTVSAPNEIGRAEATPLYSGGEGDVHSVKREDDRDLSTGGTAVESILEAGHGNDSSHERAIVSVGASAAERDENGNCKPPRVRTKTSRYGEQAERLVAFASRGGQKKPCGTYSTSAETLCSKA